MNIYLSGILLILLSFCAHCDWREQRIPNNYLILGFILRIFLLLYEKALIGMGVIGPFFIKVLSCLLILAAGILVRRFTQNGIGMGDIKLMMIMHLYLDVRSWFLTIFLSFILGTVCSGFLRLRSRVNQKIPFAPVLLIGTVIVMLLAFSCQNGRFPLK